MTPEAETAACSLEGLCFRARSGVVIVGPLFSDGGMRAQAEDRQLTGDQHLAHNLLVFAAFEIRAGVYGVLARPASRGEQGIQTIRVGPLICMGDDLATRFVLARIGDSPLDNGRFEWNFEFTNETLDLLGTLYERHGSGSCNQAALRGICGAAICMSIRTHIATSIHQFEKVSIFTGTLTATVRKNCLWQARRPNRTLRLPSLILASGPWSMPSRNTAT